MGHYVDLHSHLLPALDDGAKDAEVALRMVDAVVALGFTQLTATPHQRAGMFMPSRPAIDEATANLRAALASTFPGVQLGVAAENYWDDVFHQRLTAGGLPTYPGDKAFLFELNPQMMPPRLEANLFEISVGGRLPVMAHPERYVALQENLDRVEALGRVAALVVDLAALEGAHGRAPMKAARKIVEEGLAHAAASDIHTPEDQRAIAGGMAWIRKQLGQPALDRLLDENPRRILAGELP
jgi:protein-tyrosine phosphatase